LTQPLTEMITRNISWRGKCSRYLGLKALPSSCVDCLEIWEPQPPGTLRASPGLEWDCFYPSNTQSEEWLFLGIALTCPSLQLSRGLLLVTVEMDVFKY
jgi:hypothetical protein